MGCQMAALIRFTTYKDYLFLLPKGSFWFFTSFIYEIRK